MTATNASAPALPGIWSARHRALTLGIVTLIGTAAFEAVAVGTAMPVVAAALGGLHLYALAFAAPLAANIVGVVAGGLAGDAAGPRRPLALGLALFVAGLLVAGLAPSMAVLAAGRALQGLGGGMLIVAVYVVVGRTFDPSQRPRVFAAMAAAWVLPAMVGPAVSGLVAEQLSWRWVFLGVPPLAVAAAVAVLPRVPAAPVAALPVVAGPVVAGQAGGAVPVRGSGAVPRLGWAAALAVGAAALHLAGERGGAQGVLLAVAALALVAVSAPRLLPAGTLLLRRGLPSVVVLRGLVFAGFTAAEVFLPLLLVQQRHLSAAVAGLVLTAGALGWSAGSWWQGRHAGGDRSGLLRLGLGLQALGIAVAATALLPAVPVPVALAGWLLAGVGTGVAYPTTSVLVLEMSPPALQGRNSSALQISDSLLATLALAVSGAVLGALGARDPAAYAAGFAVAVAAALAGAVLAGRAR